MSNLTGKKIFDKVEFPPCGFILQKDVYTTNLLYANDQFPLTALKKRLPFRPKSGKKIQNPNHSVRILRENGNVSENSESKKLFYLLNNFKPKQLKNKKLKFPLPKLKAFPLSHLNLYEEISKKDLRIRNIDDDLNITSNNGRKIFYKFKEKKLTNPKKFKKSNFPLIYKRKNKNMNNSLHNKILKKKENDKSMDKISFRYIVGQLNNELKDIKKNEKERKRAFMKDKFFSTQIYFENLLDSNNDENNNNDSHLSIHDYNKKL